MNVSEKPAERATLNDFAALRFEGDSEVVKALGSAAEWSERTRNHFPTIFFAFALLKDDQDGVARNAAAEPEAFMELHRCIEDVRTYYEALAGLLNTASIRIAAGLSRYALVDSGEG